MSHSGRQQAPDRAARETVPDCAGAAFEAALRALLLSVYTGDSAERLVEQITALVAQRRGNARAGCVEGPRWVDQGDVVLISYADSIRDGDTAPLAALDAFVAEHLNGTVSAVHLLPLYPASSDDGFSVIDYRAVDPSFGNWDDIARLARRFDIMLDAVINHVSRQSAWFEAFVAGDPARRGFFHRCDPRADYSQVIRPRALPLLTKVDTAEGGAHVWTTFSEDQIDLNYATPEVLLEILDLLLFYADRGARFIRLDAIGFLWKKLGTSCMHLPETHALIQIMRLVVDAAAPGRLLITETNVPHADNVSYFGDGSNEAHMVYQFPLPPLTLYAFQTGDAQPLSDWAAALEPPAPGTTFFNFLASHDGIGVRPAEGLLNQDQIAVMAEKVEAAGGLVSMRTLPGGGTAPYEFNVSFVDAVSAPDDDDATRAAKFLAAEAILLSVIGVPAIYIHSLLGSRNDLAGMARTGRNRSINRAKLDLATVTGELAEPGSLRQLILDGHLALLRLRRTRPAFHPNADQTVVPAAPSVFSILRSGGGDRLWVTVNVSGARRQIEASRTTLGFPREARLLDLISSQAFAQPGEENVRFELRPYQAAWIASD
ncbi:MAG TPA: sugar phosphorylase [Kiloniellaceae bacterium]|nr:sugar phosphorylase [Kiloniellaceae bacterium]